MKNRIRNIEDLKREKKLLKLEMEATERLIVESFHVSKENLMESAAGSFFSMMRKEPIGISDVVQVFTSNQGHWWQRIIPFMPVVLKMAGKLYKRKKRKKDKERRLQSGELTLHRVAS